MGLPLNTEEGPQRKEDTRRRLGKPNRTKQVNGSRVHSSPGRVKAGVPHSLSLKLCVISVRTHVQSQLPQLSIEELISENSMVLPTSEFLMLFSH